MYQIVFVLLLITSSLSAAMTFPINTAQTLVCHFSKHQHNRIFIQDGRIKKIIFPEDKLHVRMEEISGQVFIQPNGSFPEKVIISIISQTGVVQDIEIEFVDQPSQVVILQEVGHLNCTEPFQDPICNECHSDDIASWIDAILHEQIPPDFISLPVSQSCQTIKSGFKALLVGCLRGWNQDLYLYRIQNTRFWQKRLCERDLSCGDALWVYLQKRCIAPKESVLAIVAVES